jgi:hypothetical protein
MPFGTPKVAGETDCVAICFEHGELATRQRRELPRPIARSLREKRVNRETNCGHAGTHSFAVKLDPLDQPERDLLDPRIHGAFVKTLIAGVAPILLRPSA